MRLYLLLLYFFIASLCSAQSYYYMRGYNDYKIKTVVPVIGQRNPYLTDLVHHWRLQYPIKNKFNILAQYSRLIGLTSFSFEYPDATFSGHGSGYTKLKRYGVGLTYDFTVLKKWIYCYPIMRVDYEKWDVQADGISIVNVIDDTRLQGTVSVQTYEGFQLLPSLGVGAEIRLFWKIYLKGEIYYSYGIKKSQSLYFDYVFDGVQQPRAEWYSDGTGFVKSFGIGINFNQDRK